MFSQPRKMDAETQRVACTKAINLMSRVQCTNHRRKSIRHHSSYNGLQYNRLGPDDRLEPELRQGQGLQVGIVGTCRRSQVKLRDCSTARGPASPQPMFIANCSSIRIPNHKILPENPSHLPNQAIRFYREFLIPWSASRSRIQLSPPCASNNQWGLWGSYSCPQNDTQTTNGQSSFQSQQHCHDTRQSRQRSRLCNEGIQGIPRAYKVAFCVFCSCSRSSRKLRGAHPWRAGD